MSVATTVTSVFELLKRLSESVNRSIEKRNLAVYDGCRRPLHNDPSDRRSIISQENVRSSQDKQVESIIRVSRFVMQNNYFSYQGLYYHQIRGGAMGSPLTSTIANCYMFFFERNIARQVGNSGGRYMRYIDDIFISINGTGETRA